MKRKNNTSTPTGVMQTHMGKANTYMRDGVEITRGAVTQSYKDAKSLPQIYHRLCINNLNAFAKKVQPFLKNCWEQHEAGLYYYQNFLRANKQTRAYGVVINGDHNCGGVLIADYQISQGSLPTIQVDTYSYGPEHGITDIAVGDLEIDENTTIGEFSHALVENNGRRFQYYDRLTFFYMAQATGGQGPTARCGMVSVLLAGESQETMRGLNLMGFGVKQGRLAIRGTAPIGGYTWIHQRAVPKTTKRLCSTQFLTMSNRTVLECYASPERMREAAVMMGATIPKQAPLLSKPEYKKVYEAFGVRCSSVGGSRADVKIDEELVVMQMEG